jgi:hypothetical protein
MAYVDILEDPLPGAESEVSWKQSQDAGIEVELDMRGFEIKTLKVTVAC